MRLNHQYQITRRASEHSPNCFPWELGADLRESHFEFHDHVIERSRNNIHQFLTNSTKLRKLCES